MFRKPNILLLRKELAKVGQNGDGFDDGHLIGKCNLRYNGLCGQTGTLESIVARQVSNSISFGSRIGTKQVRLLLRVILLDRRQRGFGRSSHLRDTRTLDFLGLNGNLCQRTLDGHLLTRIQPGRFLGHILCQRRVLIVGIQSLRRSLSTTTQRHRLSQLRHHGISDIRRTGSALIRLGRVGTQHRSRRSKCNLLSFPLRAHRRTLDLKPLHNDLLQWSLIVRIDTDFLTIQIRIHSLLRRLIGRRLVDVVLESSQKRYLFCNIHTRRTQCLDFGFQCGISHCRLKYFRIREEFTR